MYVENIFSDITKNRWWSWGALFVMLTTLINLQARQELNSVLQVVLAVLSLACLAIFVGPAIYRAATSGHRHILTVAVWSLTFVIAFLVCFYFCFFKLLPDPVESAYYDKILNVLPVVPAIWAAGLGWFIHFQFTSKAHRTNNAFSIVMEMRKSAEFLKRQELVARHFPPGATVPASYAPYFDPKSMLRLREKAAAQANSVSPEELEMAEAVCALRYILNYFEFMAAGVKANDLDGDLLYETISPSVTGVFSRAEPFISYMQSESGANEALVFQHLAALAGTWVTRLKKEVAEQ